MFGFGKKKKEAKPAAAPAPAEPPADHDELVAQAKALDEKIAAAEGVDKANLLDEQGALYERAGEVDASIDSFEASMAAANRMGPAYRTLTKLYNIKRREATEAKDDAQMKMWMDKIDGLLTGSKDMMRGK